MWQDDMDRQSYRDYRMTFFFGSYESNPCRCGYLENRGERISIELITTQFPIVIVPGATQADDS